MYFFIFHMIAYGSTVGPYVGMGGILQWIYQLWIVQAPEPRQYCRSHLFSLENNMLAPTLENYGIINKNQENQENNE